MHISTLTTAALMALATALPAAAQNAITFYGGYRGGGSFQQDTSPFDTVSLKSSATGSIALDVGLDAMRQVQIFASYQSTELEATATTPVVPSPRWMGMPQSVSAWAITAAVRCSWKHSSGWAWMSRRSVVMAAASARMDSIRFMHVSW